MPRCAPAQSETLKATGLDLQSLADRRVPALRETGLHDMAEDIEALVARLLSAAQELAAAAEELV